jgi:hypothetical protein
MKYEIRCECGQAHAVSGADAGASIPCACGRAVEVPPLHQLRASVGQSSISPVAQIEAMLLGNELPGTNTCAFCHRETNHLLRVRVLCERVIAETQASPGAVLVGCFLFGWLGAIMASLLDRSTQRPVEYGREVSFILPVRICEGCAPQLRSPIGVWNALRATPVYVELLTLYPNAEIRVIR